MRPKILLLSLLLLAGTSPAQQEKYIGSRNSNKYHKLSCQWAQKISPKNAVYFATPEEAIKAGYVPCKVCNPPTSSAAPQDLSIDKYNKLVAPPAGGKTEPKESKVRYYVGSKNSSKYHNPDCKWAKRISPANLVKFKSVAEAKKAGCEPCKICKPPEHD